MTGENKLSSTTAKEIFAELLKRDQNPEEVAKNKNLLQVSDTGEIEKIVDEVLASNEAAQAVADIKSGSDKAIGFLVGLVMKKSAGKANPGIVNKIIKEKL
jgi:aspartyl-tRNA(Asn)/glutamyl-tRNA(Gln) amidotransferase subunit B